MAAETPTAAEPAAPGPPVLSPPVEVDEPPPILPSPVAANPRLEPPPELPRRAPLISHLRALGCWPPEDYARREAGIIQWWAPRVGGLLAVLTVIFFSVYISHDASPWIRFAELIAADAACIGLGVFFHKRRPRFGTILFSVGLTMLYVSVVAGYAAPPTRVFENPIIGIASQFLVVAGIFFVSWRLRETGIALLATILGFASSFISAYAGLNEGALLSALVLQVAGLFAGSRWQSRPLIAVSSLGAYVPVIAYVGFSLIQSRSYTTPHLYSALAFLGLCVSGLPLSTLLGRTQQALASRDWHVLQIANTTLFAALGYLYFKLHGLDITLFYGAGAGLLLVWASIFARGGLQTLLFQLFLLKGSALAALWAANYFSGDLRWFALTIEMALLAWTARCSRTLWSEAAVFALWITSGILAARHLFTPESIVAWSGSWLLFLIATILATASLAFLRSAWPSGRERNILYGFACAANGAATISVVLNSDLLEFEYGAYLALITLAFASLSLLPKLNRMLPAIASVVPLMAGHLAYWMRPSSAFGFAALALASLLFAIAASRFVSNFRRRSFLCEFALLGFAFVSLCAFLVDRFGSHTWFPLVLPALAIALRLAPTRPFRSVADLFILALALDFIFAGDRVLGLAGGSAKLLVYGALLALPLARPMSLRALWITRWQRSGPRLASLAAILMVLRVALDYSWFASELTLIVSACVSFLLWRGHRHRSALFGAALLLTVALARLILETRFHYAQPWTSSILIIGAAIAIASLLFGSVIWLKQSRRVSLAWRQSLTYALAGASFLSVAFALNLDSAGFAKYYTPLLAVFCLALISVGIAARVKPYRIVALAGFVLPLGRLFLFDIRETLYRIIAFAALAALLTLIGYLYNRFASRIE